MNEWISVKDRLPPECESVLIYSRGFLPISAYLIYLTSNDPICWSVNDWSGNDTDIKLDDVTHWMQLPKPPEKS